MGRREEAKPPPPIPEAKAASFLSEIRSEVLNPQTGKEYYRKWALTQRQAADVYGVPVSRMRRWMDQGIIGVVRLPDGERRIPVEWVICNLIDQVRLHYSPEVAQRRFRSRRQAIKHIKIRLEAVVPNPDPLLAKNERARP